MKEGQSPSALLARNIRVHDRIARRYDAVHGEISNDLEQARLAEALRRGLGEVRTGAAPLRVLDFGCGSGNLTRHLLTLGTEVVAADVSRGFLDLVESRFPESVTTLQLNGRDLSSLPDDSMDMVATYSVLHHIPDYLAALQELARVTKPGGVIFIDHEHNSDYWSRSSDYVRFKRDAMRVDWRKYLAPANYLHRLRRVFNPRYAVEGDIHVWPDDHIEWKAITDILTRAGLEVAFCDDYLLNHELYRPEVYQRYRSTLTDMRMMAFRKRS